MLGDALGSLGIILSALAIRYGEPYLGRYRLLGACAVGVCLWVNGWVGKWCDVVGPYPPALCVRGERDRVCLWLWVWGVCVCVCLCVCLSVCTCLLTATNKHTHPPTHPPFIHTTNH